MLPPIGLTNWVSKHARNLFLAQVRFGPSMNPGHNSLTVAAFALLSLAVNQLPPVLQLGIASLCTAAVPAPGDIGPPSTNSSVIALPQDDNCYIFRLEFASTVALAASSCRLNVAQYIRQHRAEAARIEAARTRARNLRR